ncbi:MAG: TonB-dependent receptor domain-containing protein [Steroidobacteraceae bacterium]
MINDNSGNVLIGNAVRAVLSGAALVATFGVAHAQTNAQQTISPAANSQPASQPQQSSTPQVLAQASVPAPAAPTSAAVAQLQEVVVTGSRIATPNQTSISPVQFVSAKTFQQMGATRVEDVLNRLPQVFADQNATSINGGNGVETVDLRGLGSSRTLVLIDGQRMPYGDPRAPGADLNMIPVPLIENVQILTGGASSIYGPDAVAGVVNFKLNQNFQGVKLVANGSGYFHDNNNDQGVEDAINTFNASGEGNFTPAPSSVATGSQKELTFIAGMNTADGKGNATFYATYRNIAKATQNLYSYSACSMASGFVPGPNNPNGANTATPKFACSGSLTSYPGTFLFFGPGGSSTLNTVGPGGSVLPISAEPRFNYGPYNFMQSPEETWNSGAFLHYQLNEHAQVYASTMFMSNESVLQIAPGGDFGANLNIDCANPYLSHAELNQWCDGSTAGYVNESFATATTFPNGVTWPAGSSRDLLILRRSIEGGDRVDTERHLDWRMVLGVKGAINDNWTYDVSYQYSQVSWEGINNDESKTKMNYALDVVDVNSAGAIVPTGTPGATPECRISLSPPGFGLADGCVPWDVFQPGGVTPAQSSYLNVIGESIGGLKQHIIDSNFTGDLSQYVQLPTAHSGLQLAAGTEYIDWNEFIQPDVTALTSDEGGSGGPLLPVSGAIESFSEYLEVRLPLIQDRPFAKSLTTDDSIRHSSYGLGYATNTFSLGLAWQPIQDVRIRGTFTRAVRAPNITELYTPPSVTLDGSTDPCSGATPTYSATQCAREGVTAAEYGHILPNPAAQYNGFTGGNTDLKPETATTKSFGIQFTPTFIRNFSASIDYYDIKIDNIIRSVGENTILNDCAAQDLFCNLIHRDNHGSLWLTVQGFATDTLQNVGILEQKGIDVQFNYALDIGRFGSLNWNFTGTHISNYLITPVAALSSSQFDCAGYYGPTCSASPIGSPVFGWRHDMQVTWVTPIRPLSVTAGWRYLSGTTLDLLSPNPNLAAGGGATVANGGVSNTDAHIPAYNYLDLSAAYQVNDALLVRLGCNNLMDKSPPVIGASDLPAPPFGNGNTLPGTYDWGGRYVFGEIDLQF